jgi:hypothetical protein
MSQTGQLLPQDDLAESGSRLHSIGVIPPTRHRGRSRCHVIRRRIIGHPALRMCGRRAIMWSLGAGMRERKPDIGS